MVKFEQVIIIGIVFFTLFFIPTGAESFNIIVKFSIFRATILISLLILLFSRLQYKAFWPLLFALGYFFILQISSFITIYSNNYNLYLQQFYMLIWFFLLLYCIKGQHLIKKMIYTVIITGSFISLYGILQYLGLDPIIWNTTVKGDRVFSLLGNPDGLAIFLSIPLGFMFGLFIEANYRKNWWLLGGFLLNFTCLMMTYTRGSFVAFSLQFLVWLLLCKKHIRLTIKGTLIATVLFISIGTSLFFLQPSFLPSLGKRIWSITDLTDPSIQTRIFLWESAIEIIQQHPWFGVGLGNFSYAYLLVRDTAPEFLLKRLDIPGSSHNEFLDIGVSLGVFGLLIYLIFWSRFFLCAKKAINTQNHSRDKVYCYSLLLAGIGIFVNMQFIFATVVIVPFIWFLWGAMERLAWNYAPTKFSSYHFSISYRFIGAGIISFMMFHHVIVPLLVGYHNSQGLKYFSNKELEKAIAVYTKALSLDSLQEESWQMRGRSFESLALISRNKEMFNMAKSDYDAVISINHANPGSHADIGRLCGQAWELFKTDNWYQCADAGYAKAVELDPYNPNFWHDRGISLRNGDGWEKAEQAFKKCILLSPSYISCREELVKLYYRKGFLKKGENLIKNKKGKQP